MQIKRRERGCQHFFVPSCYSSAPPGVGSLSRTIWQLVALLCLLILASRLSIKKNTFVYSPSGLSLQSLGSNNEEASGISQESSLTDWDATLVRAVSEIRRIGTNRAEQQPCKKRAHLVGEANGIDSSKAFNCSYTNPLQPAYYCGPFRKWSSPYAWECRLKERVFSRIREHNLGECAFGLLDVGSANGDWTIAVGAEAKRSVFATVEANPQLHDNMYSHLSVNPGLLPRVLAYNAAAMSAAPFADARRSYDANKSAVYDSAAGWSGPSMCVKADDRSGYMKVGKSANCATGEVLVPIITIDSIILDWVDHRSDNGSLLFVKIDIEGGEYEALLGANRTFSSPETRPCYIYIELKFDPKTTKYDQAYDLLTKVYGYTDFEDIDSGLSGPTSYPPRGTVWDNEGNYEFRVPPSEMKACVERTRRSAK